MIVYRYPLWTARNPMRTSTEYIVIHHAADTYPDGQAVERIYRYHASRWKDYNAAGYHIIIQREPTGALSVNVVNNPFVIGAAVKNYNHATFHICLADDFTNTVPEPDWIDAARRAVVYAKMLFPNAAIVGHRELDATTCPGKRWNEWKSQLLSAPNPWSVLETPHQPLDPYNATSPIIAAPAVREPERILRTALKSRQTISDQTIDDLIAAYRYNGELAGVDWYVAMCQAIHETGWFSSFWASKHNYAGIGVTGETSPVERVGFLYNTQRNRWERGIAFPSVAEGVAAHTGRLVAYALTDHECNDAQKELVALALMYRGLPTRLRGSARTWGDLGGKWAVSETYGQRIITLANTLAKL